MYLLTFVNLNMKEERYTENESFVQRKKNMCVIRLYLLID